MSTNQPKCTLYSVIYKLQQIQYKKVIMFTNNRHSDHHTSVPSTENDRTTDLMKCALCNNHCINSTHVKKNHDSDNVRALK